MSPRSDAELEALLSDIESDLVERKASLAAKDAVCQSICSFANDLPGHRLPGAVFVGVNDDGSPSGFSVTDERLRELADLRSNGNLYPFPVMTVQKRVLRGTEVAVVEVEPSQAPPLRYRGRTYVRVGPTVRVATPEEERRLGEKRRAGDLPFDARPAPPATPEDLDLDLFGRVYLPAAVAPEVLEENARSVADQLVSLRFAHPDGTPTVLGMLVAGVEPTRFVPGAYVQFARFDGADLTDPVKDQRRVDGPLSELVREIEDVLSVNISVAAEFADRPVEERVPDYPLVALQQLVRNAVLHRVYEGTNAPIRMSWFSDRVEIQSPGGPYGQVRAENFGTPGVTDYRNPNLAEAMRNLGYVQRFGVGIPLARKAAADNGNPEPEFEVNEANVLAVVRARG